MARRHSLTAAVAALLLAACQLSAWAQGVILQGGPFTPGHAPMYIGSGQQGSQAVARDSGPAAGGGVGVGLSEGLYVARGTGTAPYAAQGTGPLGTNWCDYDAPITNATGYHYLCLSPNALGGGLIAYGSGGAASALPLNFWINGALYQFPFALSGIAGPNTSVINDYACWNNTAGTLLKDCTGVAGPVTTVINDYACWNNTVGSLLKDCTGIASLGGATGAISLGSALSMSGTTLNAVAPGDACTGPRLAKSANYSVVNADRFSLFSLGGATKFQLSLGAAGAYDSNYSVCVHNTDTANEKIIFYTSGSFILWPDQVAVLSNDNGSWAVRRPDRWKIPNSYGPVTLFTNFSTGSDALNATGCLAAASPCKTVQHALGLMITEFDFNGLESGNSSVVVQMAAGVADTQCVHYSTHGGPPGAQGGLAVTIQGAIGAALSCAVSGIEVYFGAVLYVNNVSVASSAGFCLAAHDRGKIYVGGGTQLGPCSSGGIYAQNAKIELNGTVNIVSDMAYFALAQQNGVIATNGFAVTFLNNATFSGAFTQADSGGQVNFAGTTITVAPFAAVGTRCTSAANGLNLSSTGVPNTYWPGTVNCSAFTQGQNL